MQKQIILVLMLLCSYSLSSQDKFNILVIGAHPDDCELITGGTSSKLIQKGHKVKFVSMTNGNKGHHIHNTETIERIRKKEVEEVKKRLGCEYEVLNNNDGELIATLELRNEVIRLIREWEADLVITHPNYDYHPDHRHTSTLVQDAAFMVTVPLANPTIPILRNNPVFLYMLGRLDNPNRKETEIAIDITSVVKQKAHVVDSHFSQMYEWLPWINQKPLNNVDIDSQSSRESYLYNYFIEERNKVADKDIPALKRWYGESKDFKEIKAVERYEICPFGKQVSDSELKVLFPVFD